MRNTECRGAAGIVDSTLKFVASDPSVAVLAGAEAIAAVDFAGGEIEERPDVTIVLDRLEDVVRTEDVDLHHLGGDAEIFAYAGDRREMEHQCRIPHGLLEGGEIAHIPLDPPQIRMRRNLGKIVHCVAHIDVEDRHPRAAVEKVARQRGADETGAAGQKDVFRHEMSK